MLSLPLDVTEAGINLVSHSSPPQASPLNLCLHTHFFRSNSSLEHLTNDVTAYDKKKKKKGISEVTDNVKSGFSISQL